MAMGFGSYEIARSGMFVNERALFVTGHNISNVNTPGFSRQQAMIATGPYQNCGGFQLGLGADIQQIRQIRHQFLDNIYRDENTLLGYWETRNKTFQEIQTILGDPMEEGLQNVLNQFWDSWQELSKEPDSLTVRALVRQRAEALVYHINHVGQQLDKLQNDLNYEVYMRISEVNDITRQIASLNKAIFSAEVTGDNANDYRDQRNLLIDRLSKLADVEATEMMDGQVDITLSGHYLVHKGEFTELYAGERNPGDIFCFPMLAGTNIEVAVKSGEIKGLLDSRGDSVNSLGSMDGGISALEDSTSIIPDLKRRLNAIINKMAEEINNLHKSGKTLSVPPEDGQDFFVPINPAYPIRLGNIQLNSNLIDLNNIVASKSGDSGDNSIALDIANLRNIQIIDDIDRILSIDDAYQFIILGVGSGGAEAERMSQSQNHLVLSTDLQRNSIMGVSMDEEMSNMMKFKFAYTASSRAINVIDEMIETIITKMGIVGR